MKDKSIDELLDILENTNNQNTQEQVLYILDQLDPGLASILDKLHPGNEKVFSVLINLLVNTNDEFTQHIVAYILSQIAKGSKTAISLLINNLENINDKNIQQRLVYILDQIDPGLAYILGQIDPGNEKAISVLINLLVNINDEPTRKQIAYILGQIDPGNEKAIPLLVNILETTNDESTQQRVAYILGQIDPGNERVISVFVNLLVNTNDEFTRKQIAYILGQIDPGYEKAIPLLVNILENTNDKATQQRVAYYLDQIDPGLAYCLSQIDPGNEKAIPLLLNLLVTTNNEFTQQRVAYILDQIDPGNEKAISTIINILENTSYENTPQQLPYILLQIGKGSKTAISGLVNILENTNDKNTQQQVAYILGQLDPGNVKAISGLVNILENTNDKATQQRVAYYLDQIDPGLAYCLSQIDPGNEKAISLLVNILENTNDKNTQQQVAYILLQLDPDNEKAISLFLNLLVNTNDEYTQQRVYIFGQFDPRFKTVISTMVNLLESTTDKRTRSQLLETLGEIAIGNEMAIKSVIKLLYSSSTLNPIIDTLEKIALPGNSTAIEGLRELLCKTSSAHTCRKVKDLLEKLDPRQKAEREQDEDNLLLFLTTTRLKETADRYFSVNFYQKKNFCYQRILACLDRMQEGKDIMTRRSLMQSYLQLYQEIVSFALQCKDYKKAFVYMEIFRNRYLVERIAQQDAPLPATISPQLAQNINTAKQKERQTLQAYTDSINNQLSETKLELLSMEWENAKQTLENLYSQVAQIEPEFIAKTKVFPISLQEVQTLLPLDTAIIEFFFTENQLITLLILPGEETPRIPEELRVNLKPQNLLDTLAQDWATDLADKNKSKDKTSQTTLEQLPSNIEQLAKILNFSHLENHLPRNIQQLIIIPHNILHLFPLHALPYKNQYLIDHFAIRYFPNLQIWKICQNRQRSRNTFLAIENPTADKDLIFAKAEIAGICQGHKFTKPEILDSNNAHKTKILEVAKNYHCFHFSGHAEYNFTNPLESYLMLSVNHQENHQENLTLSNLLADLHIPDTDLVTLSACCTGVIDAFQPTDECLGIATGFLLAGAKAVVSSLWKVNSVATAFLLDEFYRQLKQTPNDKAIALQKAQNWLRTCRGAELRERANEWNLPKFIDKITIDSAVHSYSLKDIPFENPYYWAPFILTGC